MREIANVPVARAERLQVELDRHRKMVLDKVAPP